MKRLNELQKSLEEIQKKMDLEAIQLREQKSLRDKELFQAINDKSKNLGFQNLETFKNFKELLEIFQIKILEFSNSSLFFSSKMKNYSDIFQTHSKQLKKENTSNRKEDIWKMLNDRKLQNLRISDPNKQDPDPCEVNLFNILERFISIDPKKFSKEDLIAVCSKEAEIIEILSFIEPRQLNRAKTPLIDNLLRAEKSKITALEGDLEKLADKIAAKKEDDHIWEMLNNNIKELEIEKSELEIEKSEGIKEEEDKQDWEERKKELDIKIRETKKEKENHEKVLSTERITAIQQQRQLKILLAQFSKEVTAKETMLCDALEEVLSIINLWFTNYLDKEDMCTAFGIF